jgi:hypothetical protein
MRTEIQPDGIVGPEVREKKADEAHSVGYVDSGIEANVPKLDIGIDPGVNGAISAIDDLGRLRAWDIANNMPHMVSVLRDLSKECECSVTLEKVNAYGQGRTSARTFALVEGHIRGACLAFGIPITNEPTPQAWKKVLGISCNPPPRPRQPWRRGETPTLEQTRAYAEAMKTYKEATTQYKRDQKNRSRERARELYPSFIPMFTRVLDTDRAEATLLAHYGRVGRC